MATKSLDSPLTLDAAIHVVVMALAPEEEDAPEHAIGSFSGGRRC